MFASRHRRGQGTNSSRVLSLFASFSRFGQVIQIEGEYNVR